MNKIALFFLLFISLFAFTCDEDSPSEPNETFFDIQGRNGFVGKVSGTDAFIAILMTASEGIVYVCNGEEEIAEWFRADISEATKINLANNVGAQILAQFSGKTFQGEVILSNDSTHTFQATPSTTEDAGIYWVEGYQANMDSVYGGWIVNSEGEERGAFKIRSKFVKPPPRPVITDGTSNTILIGESTYTVRFYRLPL